MVTGTVTVVSSVSSVRTVTAIFQAPANGIAALP